MLQRRWGHCGVPSRSGRSLLETRTLELSDRSAPDGDAETVAPLTFV